MAPLTDEDLDVLNGLLQEYSDTDQDGWPLAVLDSMEQRWLDHVEEHGARLPYRMKDLLSKVIEVKQPLAYVLWKVPEVLIA